MKARKKETEQAGRRKGRMESRKNGRQEEKKGGRKKKTSVSQDIQKHMASGDKGWGWK